MSSQSRNAEALAISCERCGGRLSVCEDARALRCDECASHYLRIASDEAQQAPGMKAFGEAVDVLTPAGRLGRRRALKLFQSSLRQAGTKGHVVERVRLRFLPFWQLEGKLVGWQRYEKAREIAPEDLEIPGLERSFETVEESLSREVVASFPACDVRSHGLLGIAHRVAAMRLRRFSVDQLKSEHEACAVVHPADAILRSAREFHASKLAPSGARRLRQRVTLVRTRLRIIYYPVWSIEYRSGGDAFRAEIDAIAGRVLKGTRPEWSRDASRPWLAAAALAAWLSGLQWPLGIYALLVWIFVRLRSADRIPLLAWLSRELSGRRRGVGELKSAKVSS